MNQGFQKYDPNAIITDISIPKNYRKATQTGKGPSHESIYNTICPVSGLPTDNPKYSICNSSSLFKRMGLGYSMVFTISKVVVIFCIIPFLMASFFHMWNYADGNDCGHYSNISERLKLYQKNQKSTNPSKTMNQIKDIQIQNFLKFYSRSYCLTESIFPKQFCDQYRDLNCSKYFSDKCYSLTIKTFNYDFKDNFCYKSWLQTISLGNKIIIDEDQRVESLIGLLLDGICFITLIAGIILLEIYVVNEGARYIDDTDEYSDYAVKIIGLPVSDDSNNSSNLVDVNNPELQDITDTINNHCSVIRNPYSSNHQTFEQSLKSSISQACQLDINDVSLIYDVSEYFKLRQELNTLGQKLNKDHYKRNRENFHEDSGQTVNSSTIMSVIGHTTQDEYLQELKMREKVSKIENYFSQGGSKNLTGAAFLTFSSEDSKNAFLERYSKSGLCYSKFGCCASQQDILTFQRGRSRYRLRVSQASEPRDIIWENQDVRKNQRMCYSLIKILFQITIIFLSFVFFVLLRLIAFSMVDNQAEFLSFSHIQSFLITTFFSIMITIFDFIIYYMIVWSVKLERNETITKRELSLIKGIWKMQFCTNALIPLMISILTINYFGSNGVIAAMNGVFISNFILIPLMRFLDFGQFYSYYLRYCISKFVDTGAGGPYSNFDGIQAYKKPCWIISTPYTFLLKTFAVGIFYYPIMPISIFYTIITLILYYWAEKYVLVKNRNKKNKYSNFISEKIPYELNFCLFLYTCGLLFKQLLIQFYNSKQIKLPVVNLLLCFIAFLIYQIDIFGYFVKKILTNKSKEYFSNNVPYVEFHSQRFGSYRDLNPATVHSNKSPFPFKNGGLTQIFQQHEHLFNNGDPNMDQQQMLNQGGVNGGGGFFQNGAHQNNGYFELPEQNLDPRNFGRPEDFDFRQPLDTEFSKETANLEGDQVYQYYNQNGDFIQAVPLNQYQTHRVMNQASNNIITYQRQGPQVYGKAPQNNIRTPQNPPQKESNFKRNLASLSNRVRSQMFFFNDDIQPSSSPNHS